MMVANKAQQELESLLNMQGQAESAEGNLAKLTEARRSFTVGEPGEEGFAFPEAAVTAVGVGWLLGPAGGLLMGIAQGILTRNERQSALDSYMQDMGILEETDSVFNDQLERLALTTENPNDLEQLSALQTQKDAALRLMASASPELQQRGSELLSDFSTRLNDYTLLQEEQRIQAETLEAEQRRELDQEQYSRYQTSINNFRSESQGYESVMQATDIALDALQNGTPSDLWAAGILINKALDPASVVRQEEAEAVGALGSIWDKANVYMEKARSGQTMLPEQRQELSGLLYRLRESNTEFQLAREARYADEVNDIGLPDKYRNNFRLATTVPASVPGDMKNAVTLPAQDIEKAAADAVFPYTDEGLALSLKYTWGNFKNWLGNTFSADAEQGKEELNETIRRTGR